MLALGVLAALIAIAPGAQGASSSTSVSVTIPSATTIDPILCLPGVTGKTTFTSVLPNEQVVTTSDCTIEFGSSNDTSRLKIRQSDSLGVAMSQPSNGDLDTGFDGDGMQSTSIAPLTGDDFAHSMARQTDGMLVTVGSCDMGGVTGIDFCLARYESDGDLDPLFGTGGIVTTDFAPLTGTDTGRSVAIQSDGKIVASGYCDMGGATGEDFCLARYSSAGVLDNTFGGDGKVTTSIAPGVAGDYSRGVRIQDDGKIVAAGYCYMGAGTREDFCMTRYLSDGSLDQFFGTLGMVTTAIGPTNARDYMDGITIQANGRVVLVGNCSMGGATGIDICLTRYTTSGALDTSFDADGIVTTSPSSGAVSDLAISVIQQDDGLLLAAGRCQMGGATGNDMCVVRYETNGTPDADFGTAGTATVSIVPGVADDAARAGVQQGDGKILLAGRCDTAGATGTDACLARLSSAGALDTTFGTGGKLSLAMAPGAGEDFIRAALLHTDGRIAVAGQCDFGVATGYDKCMAVFSSEGSVSQYADGLADWDTADTTSMFGVCIRNATDATPTWDTDIACPINDDTYWNAVPIAATQIATTTTGVADATVDMRFGIRPAVDQPPGSYTAPITFEVTAP